MRSDPAYLSHLGELATLKNFLGCYYHQDAWLDFDTDAAIWSAYRSTASDHELVRFTEQLHVLLTRSDEEVHTFFREHVDALYFIDPPDTRAWLEALLKHFQTPRSDIHHTA